MNKLSKKYADHIVALSIFIISFMSFASNTFYVAEDKWFSERTLWNDMLVFDGILNSSKEKSFSSASLGRYSRPLIKNQALLAKESFKNKNREGIFKKYKSQYGLQVKIFSWLNNQGLNINGLENLNSFLLAILISLNYLILRFCGFKNLPSAAFSSSFFINPWFVSIAKSLYWSPVTWFIPTTSLVFFLIYSKIKNQDNEILFFFVAFLTFLLRFLCGYEYLTTILGFTICSFVFISKKLNFSFKFIIKKIILITAACIFSISTALVIHSQYLGSIGVNAKEFIAMRADSNLKSNHHKEIAEYMCSLSEYSPDCIEFRLQESKKVNKANVLSVLGRYFLIPKNLPWIYYNSNQISIEDKEFIKEKLNNKNILLKFEGINYFLKNYPDIFFKTFFNRISFLFLNLGIIFFNRKNKKIIYSLIIMALPPISWFVLAKGHSYIHFHLNYVLWSIGYIPTLAYILTDNLRTIFKRKLITKNTCHK